MIQLLKSFLGTFLILTLIFWCNAGDILPKFKLYGNSYRNISVCGIQLCARNCLTESWCKSINYDQTNLLCELNYATSDSGYSGVNDNYVYSDILTWSRDIAGACANTTCNVHEKCVVLKSGLPHCLQIAFCINPSYTLDIKTNMCHKIVTGMSLNWYAADSYCMGEAGRLISMDTKGKVESIQEQIDSSSNTANRLWIGLSDAEDEGKFKWTNGNEVSFTYWTPHQPNDKDTSCPDNSLGADFAVVRQSNLWADYCWKRTYPFICEIEVKYMVLSNVI